MNNQQANIEAAEALEAAALAREAAPSMPQCSLCYNIAAPGSDYCQGCWKMMSEEAMERNRTGQVATLPLIDERQAWLDRCVWSLAGSNLPVNGYLAKAIWNFAEALWDERQRRIEARSKKAPDEAPGPAAP